MPFFTPFANSYLQFSVPIQAYACMCTIWVSLSQYLLGHRLTLHFCTLNTGTASWSIYSSWQLGKKYPKPKVSLFRKPKCNAARLPEPVFLFLFLQLSKTAAAIEMLRRLRRPKGKEGFKVAAFPRGTLSCPTCRAGSLPNFLGLESGRQFFPRAGKLRTNTFYEQ